MEQAPITLFLAIDLGFPAVGREARAILSEPGCEIPIKLGPRGIPVHADGNVVNAQLSLRESFTHQVLVDVLLYLLEAVFMAERMNE